MLGLVRQGGLVAVVAVGDQQWSGGNYPGYLRLGLGVVYGPQLMERALVILGDGHRGGASRTVGLWGVPQGGSQTQLAA